MFHTNSKNWIALDLSTHAHITSVDNKPVSYILLPPHCCSAKPLLLRKEAATWPSHHPDMTPLWHNCTLARVMHSTVFLMYCTVINVEIQRCTESTRLKSKCSTELQYTESTVLFLSFVFAPSLQFAAIKFEPEQQSRDNCSWRSWRHRQNTGHWSHSSFTSSSVYLR